MGWSMDRQGIRTTFDHESRRLKQVELSGSRRERVSLRTYTDELSAREAEVCRDAKYGAWCKPTAARAGQRLPNRNSNQENGSATAPRGVNGEATAVDGCDGTSRTVLSSGGIGN
jgi:hypothetical protein